VLVLIVFRCDNWFLGFYGVSVLILIPHCAFVRCGLCCCHLKWRQHALRSTAHFHVVQIPSSWIIIFGHGLPFPRSQRVTEWNCQNSKAAMKWQVGNRCLPKFYSYYTILFNPCWAIDNTSRVARCVQESVLHSCALLAQMDVWFYCMSELPRHFSWYTVTPLGLLLCLISLNALFFALEMRQHHEQK
jgi:hypothetical protein